MNDGESQQRQATRGRALMVSVGAGLAVILAIGAAVIAPRFLKASAPATAAPAGSQSSPGQAATDSASFTDSAPVPVASAQLLQQAFSLVYPDPVRESPGGGPMKDSDGNPIEFHAKFLIQTPEGYALVATASSENDCHACTGTIAITYLVATPEGVGLTGSATPMEFDSGSWGEPSDNIKAAWVSGRPAVRVSESSTGAAGCSSDGVVYYRLDPKGPTEVDGLVQSGCPD